MITKESIENLKNHLDVVDVVSQFIQLKKSGANFKANCPFHGEDTPSFVVSPQKQIYHCFGCGVGGDSIKFVMEYEKLSYPEAIEKLASMYNVSLEYDNKNQKKQDTKILDEVNNYYQKLLTSNETAYKYLIDRGISEFSIEKFEMGYAPTSNQTIDFLNKNFLNLSDAKELGVIDSGHNGLYARFIERITFPIHGINGKIVGFGGRTITGHNAKYVNSPQTKVFNKSRLLYGYNIARDSIYKKNKIIITEGYLDVIMLHQAGFDNAVATLGTALTAEHLPLLKRGEPKVIVAYDGDKAGLNAAYKAATMLAQNSFDGGVVIFGEGKDPADMVKEGHVNELSKIFDTPKPFIPFCIDIIISKYDIKIPEDKQKALMELKEYIKTLTPILQEEYETYIAKKLNIKQQLVHISNNNTRPTQVNLSTVDIAELQLIKTILENDSILDRVLDVVEPHMFEHHRHEFEMVLNTKDDPVLRGILLNESLKSYTDEELKQQLLVFLINFYGRKLSMISIDNNLDYKQKSVMIRKIRTNIQNLKKGQLISYNL